MTPETAPAATPLHQGPLARAWGNPWLLLTLATLFWGGNFVVGRAILPEVPPMALAFWRWTLALIPVLLLARGKVEARQELRVIRSNLPLVILLALLGIACFNSFVYMGLRQTTSINALLLQSAMPLLILVVCFGLFRERPLAVQLIGMVLSLGGVAFIASRGHLQDLLDLAFNAGDLWVMAAVLAYAFYSALLRKRPRLHPLSFLAMTFSIASLAILPFYLLEHASGQVMTLSWRSGLAMAYLVIFPSFLSYLFFNRGVELVGAGRAGIFIHLLPVFGSIMAVIFLGEQIEGFHLYGALLIGAGLVVASRAKRR